jgi:hypothetical protein
VAEPKESMRNGTRRVLTTNVVVIDPDVEAQSERAGRRTGTGYAVWYVRGEWARDHEPSIRKRGVLYKSGVYAQKALCLTPGDLPCVLGRRVRLKLAEC